MSQRQDVLRTGRRRPCRPRTLGYTASICASCPKLFEQLREALGFDVATAARCPPSPDPIEAARLGKELEPYRLFWLEDATPAENQEAFRLIRQHTTTPLAVGEMFNTIWDCKELIQNQLIDYIRTTVVHAGGITHLRRIADLADLYQVRTGCHGATDLSPVCMGAALHFDTGCPISASRNICATRRRPMRSSRTITASRTASATPAKRPATASTSTRTLAAKYPYQPRLSAGRPPGGRHDVELVTPPPRFGRRSAPWRPSSRR